MNRLTVLVISAFTSMVTGVANAESYVAVQNAEGVQAVTMHAKSYAFSPDKITVQIGVPVELRITKSGWVPHTFVIDDPVSGLNVKEKLRSSKPTVIRFTPERKGEFSFFCAKAPPFVKTHREKGMHGIFVVR